MAEHVIVVEVRRAWLRRSDGLVAGLRVTSPSHPGVIDMLLWLDREADDWQELRPYKPGMLARRGR